ncbi:PIN domain-containing protein [Aliivibrio sifiae]
MIKIVLDTNILHQEGLGSTRFQVLKRLIKSGAVSLIIPEIVIEEFKSKTSDQANEDLKKIQSAIDSMHRKNIFDRDAYEVKELVNFTSHSINSIDKNIESWLYDNQVDIYPIANTSIEVIFKNYFSGSGAFRNKKQREDIPDAVIYDCIENLSLNENIIVIAKDGALIEAINKLKKVTIYKNLSEVLEIKVLKETIENLNAGEKKVQSIIEALDTSICSVDVTEYLSENNLVEVEKYYEEEFIELPYELNNIEINTQEVQVSKIKDIFVNSPTYLGNGQFSYVLDVECEATLTFYCEDDSYESLPYEYRKILSKSESHSENEVRVKGNVDVVCQGVVVLTGIDENTDSNLLKVHLSYLGADQSAIECNVTLEKLRIEDIY